MTKKRSVASFGNPFDEEEDDPVVEEHNPIETEKEDQPIENEVQQVEQQSSGGFLDQFYEKKETKEDTHSRKTFLVEKGLLKEIENYSTKMGYGFQIRFINEAIRNQLAVVKEEEKRLKGKRRK